MRQYLLRFGFALLVILGFLLSVMPALAHERQVLHIGDTDYLFIVGSLNEPVFVDDKTGVDLRVKIADPKNPGDSSSPRALPVTGLEQTLKVEIQAGAKKQVFDLEPAYNNPGAYQASFFPTVQTAYSYRFFGTIRSTPIDVTFQCNSDPAITEQNEDKTVTKLSDTVTRKLTIGAFDCPLSKQSVTFPEVTSSNHQQDLDIANAAHRARTLTLVIGAIIIVGLLGLGFNWINKPRQRRY